MPTSSEMLVAYEAVREAYRAAVATARAARDAERKATEALHLAQLAVIVSVPCPLEQCGAPVGDRCWGESLGKRYKLGSRAQHGVRQDLALSAVRAVAS